jgi:hypothetical protein
METPNFPPNSKVSRGAQKEPVQRVTSADAVRRPPSLGKKFTQTFLAGDAPRTAWEYMVFEIIIPGARDVVVEGLQSWVERIFNGGRPRRGGVRPNPYGHFSYNRMYRGGGQDDDRPPLPTRRQLSPQARARLEFDEIILQSRPDAEEVRDRMYDILGQYDIVTVADLYSLVGIKPDHTDTTWGWTSLQGTEIGRVRGLGYLLDLPEPEPIR